MYVKLLVFSLIFAAGFAVQASPHTSAATCTDRDLSTRMGPVRDQGEIGWCYANAAADLVGFKLNDQLRAPKSAVFTALIYNYHHQNDPIFEGGILKHAAEAALKPVWKADGDLERLALGMCPSSVESEALAKTSRAPLRAKFRTLMDLKKLYDQGRTNPENHRRLNERLEVFQREGNILGTIDRAGLLRAFEISTEKTFLLHFADLLCGNQREYNSNANITVVHRSSETTWTFAAPGRPSQKVVGKNNIWADIDAELNRNNIVGVNYYQDFLLDGKIPYTLGEYHSSVIVGRRWKNGSCQYLVRNSWGRACTKTTPNGTKAPFYSPLVAECKDGNLWIEEKHLRGVSDSVVFLVDGPDPRPIRPPPAPRF